MSLRADRDELRKAVEPEVLRAALYNVTESVRFLSALLSAGDKAEAPLDE